MQRRDLKTELKRRRARLEARRKSITNRQNLNVRRTYFYLYAPNFQGRPFLDRTTCRTKEEARALGFKMLRGVVWEVVESTSSDSDRVMAELRHKRLETTNNPNTLLDRFRHKIDRRKYEVPDE